MIEALDLRFVLAASARGKIRELVRPSDAEGKSLDDAECVRRAREGDPWAEEVLYRRHVRAVAGIVTRLLSRSHEAEDVVQEAFLAAFRQLPKLRQSDAFRPWLIQIAVRLVQRRFRRRRFLRAFGRDDQPDDATLLSEVDPGADPEVRTDLAKLDVVLRALPHDARIAWILRYVEGHTLDEVAHACGCSVATVKRRVARAQAHVEQQLTVYPPDEDG